MEKIKNVLSASENAVGWYIRSVSLQSEMQVERKLFTADSKVVIVFVVFLIDGESSASVWKDKSILGDGFYI